MKERAWSQPLRALLDLLRADLFSEPQAPARHGGREPGSGAERAERGTPMRGGQLKPQVHSPQLPPADVKLSKSCHPSHFSPICNLQVGSKAHRHLASAPRSGEMLCNAAMCY